MDVKASRDLFPGALEMMVLQTLRKAPLHGYALAQVIKRSSADLLQIEEGSLYPALQRMLKTGLVEAKWGMSANNRRVRLYTLTKAGRKQLTVEGESWDRLALAIAKVRKAV